MFWGWQLPAVRRRMRFNLSLSQSVRWMVPKLNFRTWHEVHSAYGCLCISLIVSFPRNSCKMQPFALPKTGSLGFDEPQSWRFFQIEFLDSDHWAMFSLDGTTTHQHLSKGRYMKQVNLEHNTCIHTGTNGLDAELRKLLDYGFPCSLALCIVKMQLLPLNCSSFWGQCVSAKIHTIPWRI